MIKYMKPSQFKKGMLVLFLWNGQQGELARSLEFHKVIEVGPLAWRTLMGLDFSRPTMAEWMRRLRTSPGTEFVAHEYGRGTELYWWGPTDWALFQDSVCSGGMERRP